MKYFTGKLFYLDTDAGGTGMPLSSRLEGLLLEHDERMLRARVSGSVSSWTVLLLQLDIGSNGMQLFQKLCLLPGGRDLRGAVHPGAVPRGPIGRQQKRKTLLRMRSSSQGTLLGPRWTLLSTFRTGALRQRPAI